MKSWTRPGWGMTLPTAEAILLELCLSPTLGSAWVCLESFCSGLPQLAANKTVWTQNLILPEKFLSQMHRSTPRRSLMTLLGSYIYLEHFTVARGMEYLINQHRRGDHSCGNRGTITHKHTEPECVCIMFFPTWPLQ